MDILKLRNSQEDIERAGEILRKGRLVAFPTETVYGLGADAGNAKAVAAVFAAKNRPRFNPLIIHVADLSRAKMFADFSPVAHELAEKFWPGPLTLVLPKKAHSGLCDLVTAGHDHVAVRVPAHPLAKRLLNVFGGAVAAPSANPSGKLSPTTAEHVLDGLGDRIDAVLDGGPCSVGVESTIVQPQGDGLHVLRAGGVTIEQLTPFGDVIFQGEDVSDRPIAPGQLLSHYAPGASLRMNAGGKNSDEVLIGFGGTEGADFDLSPAGDPTEAAAALFSLLKEADRLTTDRNLSRIAVAPVPETGLGLAINDRLRRAAAPRDP